MRKWKYKCLMIKLVCADPFLHDLQRKQNQHLYIYYDMASATEHKAIYNMSSELGVEISYSAAHQISKFVNIFFVSYRFHARKYPTFLCPYPSPQRSSLTGAPNVNFRKISVR